MTTRNRRCWLMFALSLGVCAETSKARDPSQTGDRPLLRVATWNIAHGRGLAIEQIGHERATFEVNVDRIADAVNVHAPDVLALQEADAPSAWSGGFDHVSRIAERCGFAHVHHGVHFDVGVGDLRIAYGTALLSRPPLQRLETHRFRHSPWHTKGFVVAELEFDGQPVTLVSVHFHSGAGEIRARQAGEVLERLRKIGTSLIVMGDFNSTWTREDDALRLMVEALDLLAHAPDAAGFETFRSIAPRSRLDWILISKDLTFASYRTWPEKGSDHLAVEAEIRRLK